MGLEPVEIHLGITPHGERESVCLCVSSSLSSSDEDKSNSSVQGSVSSQLPLTSAGAWLGRCLDGVRVWWVCSCSTRTYKQKRDRVSHSGSKKR